MSSSRRAIVAAVLLALTAAVGVSQVRMWPGPPTDLNPRLNTPNDPDFDKRAVTIGKT